MEFNIRKGATLPFIEVNLIKDGRTDFNYINTNLTGSTIYFYMIDVDTGFYKISNGSASFSIQNYSVYYQFTKKNTNKVGRYEGGFKIYTDQGLIDLPIIDKIHINVLESISDTDFCCGANKNIGPIITPIPVTPTPTPTPTPTSTPTPTPTIPNVNGYYHGKFSGTSITSGQVVSNLTFTYTNSVVNSYVNFAEGEGFAYTLVPTGFTQPTGFKNSTFGCDGLNIPMYSIISQVTINNINNVPITYNVYRTFNNITGQFYSWMCG
jgi:hypothetical protein